MIFTKIADGWTWTQSVNCATTTALIFSVPGPLMLADEQMWQTVSHPTWGHHARFLSNATSEILIKIDQIIIKEKISLMRHKTKGNP